MSNRRRHVYRLRTDGGTTYCQPPFEPKVAEVLNGTSQNMTIVNDQGDTFTLNAGKLVCFPSEGGTNWAFTTVAPATGAAWVAFYSYEKALAGSFI